jgi:hypothetical protein
MFIDGFLFSLKWMKTLIVLGCIINKETKPNSFLGVLIIQLFKQRLSFSSLYEEKKNVANGTH